MQKSKKSFESLVKIIGSIDFQSKDLQNTNWTAIDHELGCLSGRTTSYEMPAAHGDDSGSQCCFPEDDGWIQSSVTILVPFPR